MWLPPQSLEGNQRAKALDIPWQQQQTHRTMESKKGTKSVQIRWEKVNQKWHKLKTCRYLRSLKSRRETQSIQLALGGTKRHSLRSRSIDKNRKNSIP